MTCILAVLDDVFLFKEELHKDIPECPVSCIKRPCPLQTNFQSPVDFVVFP